MEPGQLSVCRTGRRQMHNALFDGFARSYVHGACCTNRLRREICVLVDLEPFNRLGDDEMQIAVDPAMGMTAEIDRHPVRMFRG